MPDQARRPGRNNAPRRHNGFKYRPRWGVLILCDDEADQRETYEALRDLQIPCRVVSV